MVEFVLDFMGCEVVVVVDNEVIEFLDTLSEVLNIDLSILVVVKSQPVVLHYYFHVLIVHTDVVSYTLLVLLHYLNKYLDQVSGLIIDDVELVLEW
jgi:hypothetical protein